MEGYEPLNPKRQVYRLACFFLVRPVGLEPTTAGLEVRCSIRLSHGRTHYQLRCFQPRLPQLVILTQKLPFRIKHLEHMSKHQEGAP